MDFHISAPVLFGQLLIGLINGSFYAMMSLGVAVIFGMLRIANFVHGAQYMLGAFGAWFLLSLPALFPGLGLPSTGYWWALLLVPLLVGLTGLVTERLFVRRVYKLHHAYGLLLTVGLALVIEGLFRIMFGSTGASYATPELLKGGIKLGTIYLPLYRLWVIVASVVICFGTWLLIERTRIGAYLRAATENPALAQAFGPRIRLDLQAGGMHLLMRFNEACDDKVLQSRLNAAGLAVHALSNWSVRHDCGQGLIMSFTNIRSADAAGKLAMRLKATIDGSS